MSHWSESVLFVTGIAHFQGCRSCHKTFGKCRSNSLFDNKAFCRCTYLSGILITSGYRRFHRQFQIGIVKHNKRIRTAQFQYAFFQCRSSLCANSRSRTNTSGHRDSSNARVFNHLTDTVVVGIQPAIYALWDTRIFKHLGNELCTAHHIRRMFK